MDAENYCVLDFQETSIRNQFTVAQFSKKEQLSLLENRAREVLEDFVSGAGSWLDDLDVLLGSGTKTKILGWIDDGLDAQKLQTAFENSSDVAGLYDDLEGSKSIFHKRLYVNDRVGQIPGVSSGVNPNNGLPEIELSASSKGLSSDFNLPAKDAANFTNAQLVKLNEGEKIYRVIGNGAYETGGYWTTTPPSNYADIIGGTAVRPEWNGMEQIIEYTVPEGGINVWIGGAASQDLIDVGSTYQNTYSNYFLNGGDEQIYMPNIYRDFTNPNTLNNFNAQITNRINITWPKN